MNEESKIQLNEPIFSIGLAAEKLGVAVPTLRMYEQAGLIIPHRTPTGRRLYSHNDLNHIRVIIDLIRNQRLNIEAIKYISSLTPCWQIIDCDPEIRNKCEAYLKGGTPCWLSKGVECSRCPEDCRQCDVYLSCPKTLKDPKTFLKQFIENCK